MVDLEFDSPSAAQARLAAMRQVWQRVEGQVVWTPRARIGVVVDRQGVLSR